MRTSTLICLALLAASVMSVENKCDHHKDTAVKIATFLELASQTDGTYDNALLKELVKADTDTTTSLDTSDKSEVKNISKWFTNFNKKGCLPTKEAAEAMKDWIVQYRKKIVKLASLQRRVLAILPDMIKNKCNKKSESTELKSIRAFAKTQTISEMNGQQIINNIYKYEIKAKHTMVRIFRHVLVTVVAAQGTANEFKVKESDFNTVIAVLQDNMKSLIGMKSKIYSLAKKYLETYGDSKCRTEEGKYWMKLESDLTDHYQVYCKDVGEGDALKKGEGDCDKATTFTAGASVTMWMDNGDKWKSVAGDASKDDTIEDSQRRFLGDTGNLEKGATDGTPMLASETEDKITIGGVDSSGVCSTDTTACALPVVSTTSSTDGESSPVVTSTSSSAFMTYGFGFLALLIAAINAL